MKVKIFISYAFVLIFSPLFVYGAEDIVKPIYDHDKMRFLEYKTTNVLQCNLTGIPSADTNDYVWKWLKDNSVMLPSSDNHYVFKDNQLIIHKTREDDITTYTCIVAKRNSPTATFARADIETLGIPTAKILSQGTFIEGQKITLECQVTGNPIPTVEWRLGNQTFTQNTGRITLIESKKVRNAILQIDEAQMLDRGEYFCSAHNAATVHLNSTREAATYVRVKDKLAALWPFIGICAEVVVLCAIIFIYERKRNKAELEESDTDQSPEQKNTPDHGKESVRQRK